MRIDLDYKECIEKALAECGIAPSFRVMGKKGTFYMRASSSIEDFLAVCGMQKQLFDFINKKIENEYRNNTNRAINIEVNNIKKTLTSAKKYITAIEWLRENDRLTGLDSELSEAARLRVENPECSLSALGAMMSPAVSKSGVLHRLNRIYRIYEDAQSK
jgi:DNA-binding protein WhiA